MYMREDIEKELALLIEKYGEWTYDIPLLHDVWTKDNRNIPHTRLKRVLQIIGDVCNKPISSCRILDLGCLDGIFSIEFALHGATVIGVEIREANIKKAIFCKDVLELNNLEFIQDDIRNISLKSLGEFDVILCSGILYHLPALDAIHLIEQMYAMTKRLVIIDTRISLDNIESVPYKGKTYYGKIFQEHNIGDTQEKKAKRLWASWDNNTSFWFTRPSLINCLSHIGFSSIHECFNPPHLNFGKPGIECKDRCTFIAIKGETFQVYTSPTANNLQEDWPEDSLTYIAERLPDNYSEKTFTDVIGNVILKFKRAMIKKN